MNDLSESVLFDIVDESLNEQNIIFSRVSEKKNGYSTTRTEIKAALMTFCEIICRYKYLPEEFIFSSIFFWSQYLDCWDIENVIYFTSPDKRNSQKTKNSIKEFFIYNTYLSKVQTSITNLLFRDIISRLKHNLIQVRYLRNTNEKSIRVEINYESEINPKLITISFYIPQHNKNLFNSEIIDLSVDNTLGNTYDIFKKCYSKIDLEIIEFVVPPDLQVHFSPTNSKRLFVEDDESLLNFKKALFLISSLKNWGSIYGLPVIMPSRGNLIGNAILYVVLDELPHDSNRHLKNKERLFKLQRLFSHYISRLVLPDWEMKVKKSIITHAIKSAQSAVMTRNMSHNIGSHVLNYLINSEDRFSELKETTNCSLAYIQYSKLSEKINSYLRNRMDFIAGIITHSPSWFLALDFLYEIFSELYGDLNFRLEDQILWVPNLYLLFDNIVRSEEIRAEDIEFEILGLKSGSIILGKNRARNNFKTIAREVDGYNEKKIDIPLGIVGLQALFIIIENIIRNSAKHGLFETLNKIKKKEEFLKIKIIIQEPKEEAIKKYFYKIIIHDNLGGWDELRLGKEKFRAKLNPLEDEGKIIDNSGVLIQENFGLKELFICSAFLRGISVDNFLSPHDPTIIEPIIADKNNLGYRIYLRKPKELLIVSENTDKKPSISSVEIDRISVDKLIEFIKGPNFSHPLILINTEIKDLEKKKTNLPFRIIENVEIEDIAKVIDLGNKKINLEAFNKKEQILLLSKAVWIKHLIDFWKLKNLPTVLFQHKGGGDIEKNQNYIKGKALDAFSDIFLYGEYKEVKILSGQHIIVFDHKWENHDLFKARKEVMHYCPFRNLRFQRIGYAYIEMQVLRNRFINWKLLLELIEVGLTSIVCLDERIFKDKQKKKELYGKRVGLSEFWAQQNVFIFNLKKDNGAITIESSSKKNFGIHNNWDEIKKDYFEYFEINTKLKIPVVFLIVHQGIIDKIGGKDKLQEILKLFNPKFLVITSGRGKDKKRMPENAKFLEFSNLRNFLIDNPDKWLLKDILYGLK